MKLRLLSACWHGAFKMEELKQARDSDDDTLVCPICGNCTYYLVPFDDEGNKIENWKKYLENNKPLNVEIENRTIN